jgi:RNA polymerase sigma-70 factor (ECF subfamily)
MQDQTGYGWRMLEEPVNARMLVEQSGDALRVTRRLGTIEALFEAMETPLLSYAHRLLRDLEAAEDVVQEAFIQLHGQFAQVRDPRRWLYRTVHNRAVNHLRRASRSIALANVAEDLQPTEPQDPQPLPDEQIARLEGVGLVRLSLERMEARSREVIELKFRDGLSYREIGEKTGLTVGHVGYLLHHALKALAEDLANTGIIP